MPKRYQDIAGDGGSHILRQIGEQVARLAQRMSDIRHKVAILSGKGGVGKSALTVNLAYLLSQQGYNLGIVDADLSGPSIPKMLGIREQPLFLSQQGVVPAKAISNIQVVSLDFFLPREETPANWDGPVQNAFVWKGTLEAGVLREFLSDISWGELDFLFLDLPPGTALLPTIAQLLPDLGGAVIVTIPSQVSHFVVKKSITLSRELNIPIIGLVENMAGYSCPHCGSTEPLFGTPQGNEIATQLGVPYLGQVPFDPRLSSLADAGRPFALQHSHSPTGKALTAVAKSIASFFQEDLR